MSIEERPVVGQRMPSHRGTRSHSRDLPHKGDPVSDAPIIDSLPEKTSEVPQTEEVHAEAAVETSAVETPVIVPEEHKNEEAAPAVVDSQAQEGPSALQLIPARKKERPQRPQSPARDKKQERTERPKKTDRADKPAAEKKAPGFLSGIAEKTRYAFSLKTDEDVQKPAPRTSKKDDNKSSSFRTFVKTRKLLTSILVTIALIILVVIIAAIVPSSVKEETPDTSDYMDRIRTQEIRINDEEAIDSFFRSYYTALSSGNTTALELMYDDPSAAHITTEISTIVNQYDNFKVYITRGINENEYVAFVYNDIHFANIEATAPSVDSFYLKYDPEAAALKICAGMYQNPEILKFMNLISYRDPIHTLLNETNEKLSDALAGNVDLNNLYIIMQSMAETEKEE